MHISTTNQPTEREIKMDKLIINTAAADYNSVILAFIRAGFSVNHFVIHNGLLIIEISSYKSVAISNCDFAIIAQSIYEIETVVGIDNVKMQQGNVILTINDNGCHATAEQAVNLDFVYETMGNVIANRVKSVRSEQLAHCYAIVQAEQLAEDIAFNIHFNDCKKRLYHIDFTQYDAATLRNTLAQLGIKSYTILQTRNLVIA